MENPPQPADADKIKVRLECTAAEKAAWPSVQARTNESIGAVLDRHARKLAAKS